MTPCEQIAADAPGLASLPTAAPERARAEEHAAGCAACRRALDEAGLLMRALDGAPPPLPAPEALRAAAAPILRDLGQARRPRAGRAPLVAAAAALASWALPLAFARRPLGGGRTLGASIVLALVAAVAAATTVTTGGVVAGTFPVLSTIMSLVVGEGEAFRSRIGVHCALTELALAAGAALLAGLVTRRSSPADPAVLAAAAGGGALAGQAALHLTCPAATELPHLLVFHSGALMLALVLSLAAARVLLALRPPPSRAE